jgi:hypothetical protein
MDDDVKMTAITIKKSPPNWREVFEQVLAAGCPVAEGGTECIFCKLIEGCRGCPAENKTAGYDCAEFWGDFDSSLRRAIFRHVLKNVSDFTDVTEIRERIAEMLDDPAKFLGKAEPEKKYQKYHSDGGCYTYRARLTDTNTPEFHYLISYGSPSDEIIAAFRDEETRDRVLEFLNA